MKARSDRERIDLLLDEVIRLRAEIAEMREWLAIYFPEGVGR